MENRNEDILGTQDKSGEVGTPARAGKAWLIEGQRSAERAKPGTLLHDKSHWEARGRSSAPGHNEGYIQ